MAYIKNEELKEIKKALYNGTPESVKALAIIQQLEKKQQKNAKKTWQYIKEKRKNNKNYARKQD